MDIIRLTRSDPVTYFRQVAQIHTTEIRHGALPLLGTEFLRKLYYALAQSPKNSIWVAQDKGMVLGFLAGCADFNKSCRQLAWQHGVSLGWNALRSMLAPGVLVKILSLFVYPFRNRGNQIGLEESLIKSSSRAELLAMAVHHEAQRQGIGRGLVRAFEKNLSSWGVIDGYWVATDCAQQGSNQFYMSVGFVPVGKTKHHHLVLQHYYKKIDGTHS
ncbi:MAG: GNAT family N-acetyltransferase [Terriglobia bacterium]